MTIRALFGSLALTLALSACYNPELGGPGGFLCRNNGPCPSGTSCVNDRCVRQGQPGQDARIDGLPPDGPTPRPEARVDGRGDRTTAPDARMSDGPSPPPPTCKLLGQEEAVTVGLKFQGLDDRFDYELEGTSGRILFRAKDLNGAYRLALANRLAGKWEVKWLPIPSNHVPTGFHSIGLAEPKCPLKKDVIVYQAQGLGVHYIADDGTSALQPQGSVDAQQDVGDHVDVVRAHPTSITPVPSCASFWVLFSAGSDGMRRALLDLGPPMVHWNQAVPTGPPSPQQLPASQITQHWDGNNHYFHFEAGEEVRVRVGQGNNTTPLDPSFSMVDLVKAVPPEDRGISAALDRFVFVGFDPGSSGPFVRFHDQAGIVSPVAPGKRPSLAINETSKQDVVTFIDGMGVAQIVARKTGQPWSSPAAIKAVSRIAIRAAPNNEWEVVYARPGPSGPDLFSARYACP